MEKKYKIMSKKVDFGVAYIQFADDDRNTIDISKDK